MSEVSVGYGPLARVEGPPPIPPLYGLLQAAAAPVSGVRIVTDADEGERWINGVQVYPYPVNVAEIWDACRSGSGGDTKATGDERPLPEFGAMTVYLADSCTAFQVTNQDEFRARAAAVMAAVEGAAVEREFLTGDDMPAIQPHLSDGNGSFPNADSATSPTNALALLEAEIAASGRRGVIHVSPILAVFLDSARVVHRDDGVLQTVNGTLVIPGYGYVDGATPLGHTAAGAGEEWAYATGPIDIRRSEIFLMPDTLAEALDRGLGATNDRPNSITYFAERYYLVDWDTVVQAAVLVDRCQETC